MTSQPGERPEANSLRHGDQPTELIDEAGSTRGAGPLCPSCGSHNRAQSQFCGACGAPLARYCPHCGQRIEGDRVSCERCWPDPARSPAPEGRCQSCGFRNDAHAERCERCGARLLTNCARCGSLIPASFSYCPQCGLECSSPVIERVIGRFEGYREENIPSRPTLQPSSALMVALVLLSVALMIYILRQI